MTAKKPAPDRTFENRLTIYQHQIAMRWWGIVGDVTDESLETAAEEHIKELLADEYSSGQLVWGDSTSTATGWWEIVRDVVRVPDGATLWDVYFEPKQSGGRQGRDSYAALAASDTLAVKAVAASRKEVRPGRWCAAASGDIVVRVGRTVFGPRTPLATTVETVDAQDACRLAGVELEEPATPEPEA